MSTESSLDLVEGVVLENDEQREEYKNAVVAVEGYCGKEDMSEGEIIKVLSMVFTGRL